MLDTNHFYSVRIQYLMHLQSATINISLGPFAESALVQRMCE